MPWEVRFFAGGRAIAETPRGPASTFRAERDALTHARFLLHGAREARVEVFDRDTWRRAIYRLRGDRMVALADPP